MPGRDRDATVVLARGDVELGSWPMRWSGHPGFEAVEELARLQLAARRLGCSIRLEDPCVELCELIDLAGLRAVLLAAPCLE